MRLVAFGYFGLVGCFVLDCEFAASTWVAWLAFIGCGDCWLVWFAVVSLCLWVVWFVFLRFLISWVWVVLIGFLFRVWVGCFGCLFLFCF